MTDNSMQKELYKRLFVFPILPCLGALLQIVLPGTTWTFPATTLAVLINYTTIQNGYMARDHLTGLFNRGQLENFMNYQLKNIKKGNYFFLTKDFPQLVKFLTKKLIFDVYNSD